MTLRPAALLLASSLSAAGCGHAQKPSEASAASVSQPSSPKDPYNPSGWRTPPGAWLGERNRCIDRELARRELNEFGDPVGTQYAEGRPLGVTAETDRYGYVMKNRPEIRTVCSSVPGGPLP